MRIGYCTNLIATQIDGTGGEWIEKGQEYGFDYVELPLAQMVDLNDKEFSSLKEKVGSYGVDRGHRIFLIPFIYLANFEDRSPKA